MAGGRKLVNSESKRAESKCWQSFATTLAVPSSRIQGLSPHPWNHALPLRVRATNFHQKLCRVRGRNTCSPSDRVSWLLSGCDNPPLPNEHVKQSSLGVNQVALGLLVGIKEIQLAFQVGGVSPRPHVTKSTKLNRCLVEKSSGGVLPCVSASITRDTCLLRQPSVVCF